MYRDPLTQPFITRKGPLPWIPCIVNKFRKGWVRFLQGWSLTKVWKLWKFDQIMSRKLIHCIMMWNFKKLKWCQARPAVWFLQKIHFGIENYFSCVFLKPYPWGRFLQCWGAYFSNWVGWRWNPPTLSRLAPFPTRWSFICLHKQFMICKGKSFWSPMLTK